MLFIPPQLSRARTVRFVAQRQVCVEKQTGKIQINEKKLINCQQQHFCGVNEKKKKGSSIPTTRESYIYSYEVRGGRIPLKIDTISKNYVPQYVVRGTAVNSYHSTMLHVLYVLLATYRLQLVTVHVSPYPLGFGRQPYRCTRLCQTGSRGGCKRRRYVAVWGAVPTVPYVALSSQNLRNMKKMSTTPSRSVAVKRCA